MSRMCAEKKEGGDCVEGLHYEVGLLAILIIVQCT